MSRLSRFIHFYTDEDDGNGREEPFVLKTVTGTLLHITDALAKPAKKFVATLEPIQDLHGQDAPYPAGGGKNQWPEYETQTLNEVTLTNDSGKVTINGTASTDTCFDINTSIDVSSGTTVHIYAFNPTASTSNRLTLFVITTNGNPQTNLNNANASFTYISSSDRTITKLRLRVPSGVQYTNFILYPYLQIGGTAPTSWSPYSNICPITGHTGANVVRTGKNLCGGELFAEGFRGANGFTIDTTNKTFTFSRTKAKLFENMKYKENTRYSFIFSYTGGRNTCFNLYYTDGTNDQGRELPQSNTKNTVVITSTEGKTIAYAALVWKVTNTVTAYYEECGIFEGVITVDNFESYVGTTIPITFPDAAGTVYGGTLDVVSWKLVVTHEQFAIGSATVTKSTGSYQTFVVNTPNTMATGESKELVKSSAFNGLSQDNISSSDDNYVWGSSASGNIRIKYTAYADKTSAEFKQDFSDAQLVYELATPIEYTLSESQALTLLRGENVVWCDNSDDLELTYYAKAEETTP